MITSARHDDLQTWPSKTNRFSTPHGRNALEYPLGFFRASRAPGEIAFLRILSAGDDERLPLHAELQKLGAMPQPRPHQKPTITCHIF